MLLLLVSIYLIATLVVGIYAARKVRGTEDFVLAGRNLPFHLSLSAFFATWFGAETVLGASAQFARHGFRGIIEDPLGASLCLLLTGVVFVRHFYTKGYLSIGDYFRARFGARFEFSSSLIQALSYFTYTAAQFVALGLVLQTLSGQPFTWCMAGGTFLVVLYTLLGGMWAIAFTDFVQSIVIIAGLTALALFLVNIHQGPVLLSDLMPVSQEPFWPTSNPKEWAIFLTAWMVMGFGSIPSQDIFQRVLSAKSEKVARQSAIASGFLYLAVAALPLYIMLLCLKIYGHGTAEQLQQMIPMMVLLHMPLAIQALFFGALVSAILSTASASLLAQATVIGENLLKPSLPALFQKHSLLLLRALLVVVAIISVLIGTRYTSIFHLSSISSSIVLVTLFIPLSGGLLLKKSGQFAAHMSMASGLLTLLFQQNNDNGLYGVFLSFVASVAGFQAGYLAERHIPFVRKRVHHL